MKNLKYKLLALTNSVQNTNAEFSHTYIELPNKAPALLIPVTIDSADSPKKSAETVSTDLNRNVISIRRSREPDAYTLIYSRTEELPTIHERLYTAAPTDPSEPLRYKAKTTEAAAADTLHNTFGEFISSAKDIGGAPLEHPLLLLPKPIGDRYDRHSHTGASDFYALTQEDAGLVKISTIEDAFGTCNEFEPTSVTFTPHGLFIITLPEEGHLPVEYKVTQTILPPKPGSSSSNIRFGIEGAPGATNSITDLVAQIEAQNDAFFPPKDSSSQRLISEGHLRKIAPGLVVDSKGNRYDVQRGGDGKDNLSSIKGSITLAEIPIALRQSVNFSSISLGSGIYGTQEDPGDS